MELFYLTEKVIDCHVRSTSSQMLGNIKEGNMSRNLF